MAAVSSRDAMEARRAGDRGETLVHATCVALGSKARPLGILLLGPSGSGKSDLALRLIHEQGARLVSDDQVRLMRREGRTASLVAGPAPRLAGLLEVRGLGILRLSARQLAARTTLGLAVVLVPPAEVERLPTPWPDHGGTAAGEGVEYLGISLPLLRLSPFEMSAALKVRLAAGLRSGSIRRFA